jgi:hypothetical protein
MLVSSTWVMRIENIAYLMLEEDASTFFFRRAPAEAERPCHAPLRPATRCAARTLRIPAQYSTRTTRCAVA